MQFFVPTIFFLINHDCLFVCLFEMYISHTSSTVNWQDAYCILTELYPQNIQDIQNVNIQHMYSLCCVS